jgi:competence protein ComEC
MPTSHPMSGSDTKRAWRAGGTGPGGDFRLVPLAFLSWAATWVATAGTGIAVVGCLAAAAACAAATVVRRSAWGAAWVVVVVAYLGVGLLHHGRVTSGPVADLAAERAVVTLEAVVSADLRVRPAQGTRTAFGVVRARVEVVAGRGAVWRVRAPALVTVSGAMLDRWQRLPVGTRVVFPARLEPPRAGSDVSAVVRVRGPTQATEPPSAGLRAVEHVRSGLRTAVAGRTEEQRALVPALVLGDTSGITASITADFRTTGLTHLTAVSGANLTLLLVFLSQAARWVGLRGLWLHAVGLCGVAVFVALCRTEPSVLRAAAMGLVALAALSAGGAGRGLRNLAVAVLALLLLDPYLSRSLGFTLSVLATAGIVWWAGRWTGALEAWLPRPVAESVAVPLAAHLATLPVVAVLSGRVSVIGVMTNAVAGPFVGPATVSGFAAAGLSVMSSGAAAAAGWVSAWSAQMILWTAHLGARLPGASWPWPSQGGGVAVLTGAALALAWVMPQLLRTRLVALTLALLLTAALLRPPPHPGWPPRDWVMVACDVGQGDGLVLRVAAAHAIVVDTGPEPEPIRRCLDQLRVDAVPLLVLTHFHADHVGGLPAVLGRRVGAMWTSPLASPPAERERVYRLAGESGVPVRVPAVGEQHPIGQARVTVVGPVATISTGKDADGESSAENDASLVLLVEIRGIRILLTGDVEPAGQQALLQSGADLRADVLKLPHHGSARQETDFLSAIRARVAVASAGLDNGYGHPAPRTVQLVAAQGMALVRTDLQGSVAITLEDGRLGAVAQRASARR